MKTPAIVATLTVVGSLAFAAGQGATRQEPISEQAAPTFIKDDGREPNQPRLAASQALPPCEWVINYQGYWFTEAHFLPACIGESYGDAGLISQGRLRVDIDGDGAEERVVPMHQPFNPETYSCEPFQIRDEWVQNGVPWCSDTGVLGGMGNILFREVITWTGGETVVSVEPLLDIDHLRWFISSTLSGANLVEWKMVDLRDIDNDGDLDLVMKVKAFNGFTGTLTTKWLWIRNTRGGSSGFAGADLNQDGNVDGIDLGLLLASWGS